jgi:hypothetical protein
MNEPDVDAAVIFSLIYFGLKILYIVGLWKIFSKEGLPGWGVLIPIYNVYLLCKLAGKPGWWWLTLFFIPIVNIIFWLLVVIGIAENFDKGIGWAIASIFFAFILYSMVRFSDEQYVA